MTDTAPQQPEGTPAAEPEQPTTEGPAPDPHQPPVGVPAPDYGEPGTETRQAHEDAKRQQGG